MIVGIWLSGLVRRRTAGLAGSAAAVALAVALLASVGAFLQSAKITMTRRTIQSVAVDWQVEIGSGTDPRAVTAALMAGAAQAAATVAFGTTTGLSATTGSTTQTTGPGVVIGVSDDYAGLFPGEIRPLLGASRGVLVAQQTAANLHVTVGDIVTVQRAGLGPETRRIDGVVDLPQADSLFQHVGASAGSQPTAPPDNVLVVPQDDWHALMDPLTAAHPELTRFQVHTRLVHRLPNDPAAAFSRVTGLAHHLEAQLVGGVTVGDNLAAALDGARSDALYAQLLFLFLAIPGSVVAGLLASAANAAGGDRRRRSLAIMRARGATRATLGRLAVAEAAAVGVAGSAAGLAVAAAIGAVGFGSALFDAGIVAAAWGAGAVVVGMVIATLAVALPAWRDGRELTVASATRAVVPARHPRWTRLGLDGLCLAAGALLVWATSRGGYQLVLAPEGIPALSVNYAALLGPALLWLGGGLFVWRLCSAASASRALPLALRPLAGGLAHPIAATFRRQRRRLATAAILIALAVAFAASTATFNSTYRQQAAADARLTNGADVTVTEPPGSSSPGGDPSRITRTPGVSHSEPLQHRFAYVGADLQDLYGVDPATVTSGAHLQNAYVAGGHVSQTMQKLARQDDGILVSAETVNDFQLRPGDLIRLRLTSRATGQQIEVPFHLVGVVKEFPTAPRDSFLVANSRYIADKTGDNSIQTFLVDTKGASPAAVAAALRTSIGPAAQISDIASTRRIVGSSLTAVDLRGLTKVELAFALTMAGAAVVLALATGMQQRRRTLDITRALGARPGQVAAAIRSEVAVVGLSGVLTGAILGTGMAFVLTKVLTGVFDPPPDRLSVPWAYLATLASALVVMALLTSMATLRAARRPIASSLRAT